MSKKLFIVSLLLLFCLSMAVPAFAEATDPDQLRTDITKTALVIALIVICVASLLFVIKQQFSALAAFLGISIIVITIVATKGSVLVEIANWVASWFGAETLDV